jgi:hypothetical protein
MNSNKKNQSPILNSFIVKPENLIVGEEALITVNAYDPENNELSYYWNTTGGRIEGDGNQVHYFAPDRPGCYKISVLISDNNHGKLWINKYISVYARCFDTNKAPIFKSMTAAPQIIKTDGRSTITVDAFDPDSDQLTYSWEVEGGRIEGEGAEVTYLPTDVPGTYRVTVVISDQNGEEIAPSCEIVVEEGEPPNYRPIVNQIVAAPEVINTGELTLITIDAYDPDGDQLSYSWSTNGGTIKGYSNEVVYQAPTEPGTYTVSAIINDNQGGYLTVSKDITVERIEQVIMELSDAQPPPKL